MSGIDVPAPSERPLLLQAYRALLYAVTAADRAARKGSTREDKRESGEAYEAAEKAIAALAAPLPAPSEREVELLKSILHRWDTDDDYSLGSLIMDMRAALSVPPTDPKQTAAQLMDAISMYWALAFAEGEEGRDHDTEAGDAAECFHRIKTLIAALSVPCRQDTDTDEAPEGSEGESAPMDEPSTHGRES